MPIRRVFFLFSLLSQGLEEHRNYRLMALASREAGRITAANQHFQEMLNLCLDSLGLHFLNYIDHLVLEGDQVSITFKF